MLLMNFLLGMIAGSLHKKKTFNELAQGYPTNKDALDGIISDTFEEQMVDIGKALTKLMFLFFVASFLITLHHGFKWYYAFGISILIGWLLPWIPWIIISLKLRKHS